MSKKTIRLLSDEQRLLLDAIPDDLTEREIARYYTLLPEDLEVISSLRSASNRLGFAMQLCSLRFPGCPLSRLSRIPDYVLLYVSHQVKADVKDFAMYGRRAATMTAHLERLRQVWNYRHYDGLDMLSLARRLLPNALENDQPLPLIQTALQWMREKRILRPALSTVERLVWLVLKVSRTQTEQRLTRLLQTDHREALNRLLIRDEKFKGRTALHWLRQSTGQASRNSLNQLQQRIAFIKDLDLPDIPEMRRTERTAFGLRYPQSVKAFAQPAAVA